MNTPTSSHTSTEADSISSSLPFGTITILGPGLLGGSLAMAARAAMPEAVIRLWARRETTLQQALDMGIADATCTDPAEAVRGADLVVLATPIGAFRGLAEQIAPSLAPGAIVTDVGSVKNYVHRTTGAWLHEQGHTFIGSHPMAGSEKQGLEAACPELFRSASIVLTNDHAAPEGTIDRLRKFWECLGGKCYLMESKHHDRTVARISHMPHVLAALCAYSATRGDVRMHDLQNLAATGFRDTTRVCSGSPSMWTDILWENDCAIREILHTCLDDLTELIRLLEIQDKETLHAWLEQARNNRETIIGGQ